INGFYTDEGKAGSEWTNGSNIGYLDLIDVTENVYKAIATDLEPDTKYYYQVGSESGEKSSIGTFETAGESGDEFTFIHYTDTQNAYWNEHVRNEATFGADTIKQALEVNEDSNFVLHTGDLVQIAEVEDEWVDIYSQSEESGLNQPLAVALVNYYEYTLHSDSIFEEKFNEHMNVPVTNQNTSGG